MVTHLLTDVSKLLCHIFIRLAQNGVEGLQFPVDQTGVEAGGKGAHEDQPTNGVSLPVSHF